MKNLRSNFQAILKGTLVVILLSFFGLRSNGQDVKHESTQKAETTTQSEVK